LIFFGKKTEKWKTLSKTFTKNFISLEIFPDQCLQLPKTEKYQFFSYFEKSWKNSWFLLCLTEKISEFHLILFFQFQWKNFSDAFNVLVIPPQNANNCKQFNYLKLECIFTQTSIEYKSDRE
jgi:hypothetical protein